MNRTESEQKMRIEVTLKENHSVGTVRIWYNGTLTQTSIEGNVEIWQGTGDICVVFPKDYNGRQMRFFSSGGNVQIQTLR